MEMKMKYHNVEQWKFSLTCNMTQRCIRCYFLHCNQISSDERRMGRIIHIIAPLQCHRWGSTLYRLNQTRGLYKFWGKGCGFEEELQNYLDLTSPTRVELLRPSMWCLRYCDDVRICFKAFSLTGAGFCVCVFTLMWRLWLFSYQIKPSALLTKYNLHCLLVSASSSLCIWQTGKMQIDDIWRMSSFEPLMKTSCLEL